MDRQSGDSDEFSWELTRLNDFRPSILQLAVNCKSVPVQLADTERCAVRNSLLLKIFCDFAVQRVRRRFYESPRSDRGCLRSCCAKYLEVRCLGRR